MVCLRLSSKEELEDLVALNNLVQETSTKKYYPYHKDWVKKAIREIRSGARFAFGIYDAHDFLGSVIVKNGLSSDLELKNFIVSPDIDEKGSKLVRNKILEYVEAFGQRNDYDLLSIDIVTKQISELNYFLSKGFTISYLKQYPKKETYNVYSLLKVLNSTYNEDPLSFEKMAEWILKFKYNFSDIRAEDFRCSTNISSATFQKYHFTLESSNLNKEYQLNGEAIICEIVDEEEFAKEKNLDSVVGSLFSESSSLRLFFNSSLDQQISGLQWFSYNRKDVYRILEKHNLRKVPFNTLDVGGAIFYLDDFVSNLIFPNSPKIQNPSQNDFLLYLVDSHVSELKEGDFIFFCSLNKHSEPVIKGKSEVVAISNDSIKNIDKKYQPNGPVPDSISKMSKDFFDPYGAREWQYATSFIRTNESRNKISRRIWILGMTPVEQVTTESDNLDIIPLLRKEMKNYVLEELSDSFTNTVYLDVTSVKKINKLFFKDKRNDSNTLRFE